MEAYFQHAVPGVNIRLERGTKDVPKDGKYHIVKKNKIIYSTKVFKKAELQFRYLLKKMGYNPRPREKLTAMETKNILSKQSLNKFFQAFDNYWDNSYNFRKGGRLNKR